MATQYDDPLEAAENAQPRSRTIFGQLTLTSWFCVLEKGLGKVPFDPAEHKVEARRTAIRIEVQPLASSGLTYSVMRELIAESPAWTKIVLPSIKTLGVPLSGLNGKFVQVELTPTGRHWTDALGQEHDETMPKFLAVYQSQEECEQASGATGDVPATQLHVPPATPVVPGNGNGNNPERAAAAQFLPALWKVAGQDRNRFYTLIAQIPVLAKWFDPGSPEVLAITGTPF